MGETVVEFQASDGRPISVRRWMPEGRPKAAVLVVHGMIEHSGRYAALARALVASGYAVWAPDHRGHGLTAQADNSFGFLSHKDGFFRVMDDLHELSAAIRAKHPGLKLFLFAHSMGSFLGRGLISRWGSEYAGCILSGTAYKNVPWGFGAFTGALASALLGERRPAPLLAAMGFAGYNRDFEPALTPVDWHCDDPENNQAFMDDPFCTFICSHEFFRDLSRGCLWLEKRETMEAIPKDLPLWLFAGALDPVGQRSGAVERLASDYRALGIREVTCTIYAGGRHEMLNMKAGAEVISRVVEWFGRH